MEKPIVSKKGNKFSICAIIAFNFIFKILDRYFGPENVDKT